MLNIFEEDFDKKKTKTKQIIKRTVKQTSGYCWNGEFNIMGGT